MGKIVPKDKSVNMSKIPHQVKRNSEVLCATGAYVFKCLIFEFNLIANCCLMAFLSELYRCLNFQFISIVKILEKIIFEDFAISGDFAIGKDIFYNIKT